jgi:hypothetical protein
MIKTNQAKKTYEVKLRLTPNEYKVLTNGGYGLDYPASVANTPSVIPAFKNTLKEQAEAKVSRALRLAVKFKEYGVTTEKALREKINRNIATNACDHTSETYLSS